MTEAPAGLRTPSRCCGAPARICQDQHPEPHRPTPTCGSVLVWAGVGQHALPNHPWQPCWGRTWSSTAGGACLPRAPGCHHAAVHTEQCAHALCTPCLAAAACSCMHPLYGCCCLLLGVQQVGLLCAGGGGHRGERVVHQVWREGDDRRQRQDVPGRRRSSEVEAAGGGAGGGLGPERSPCGFRKGPGLHAGVCCGPRGDQDWQATRQPPCTGGPRLPGTSSVTLLRPSSHPALTGSQHCALRP